MIVALLWLLSSGALTTTGNLVLVNYLEKRLLMTSPKAGATIAAQLVFQREGVLEKARKRDPFIHTYRIASVQQGAKPQAEREKDHADVR